MISIAVTGGIGSGKSVVCRVVECMGYPVYDCDSRAKAIIDNNPGILAEISKRISTDVIENGRLNRSKLSSIVFSDPTKLTELNRIVHSHVRDDIRRWMKIRSIDSRLVFIETAILKESEIDLMVDEIWIVHSPECVRKERLRKFRGIDEQEFDRRSSSQNNYSFERCHVIINEPGTPLLPRIENLIAELMQE